MKSFKKGNIAFKRPPNIVFMILAVIAASIMWGFVNRWNKVEVQVDVDLDYYGIPSNLMVINGMEDKLKIRLRGPERLLRSVPKELYRRGVDLSDIKQGHNTIPIGHDQLDPLFRAVEVIDIQPARIELEADRIIERSVSVVAEVVTPFDGNTLTYEDVTVNPTTVVLRGPASKVSTLSELKVPIRLDPKLVGKPQSEVKDLDTPNFVMASPSKVKISYTITSSRETITVECPIKVAGDVGNLYEVKPKTLTLQVEVPEALQKNREYLDKLEATVAPPALKGGESVQMKPRINWPEGMIPLRPFTGEVTVSRKIEQEPEELENNATAKSL